MLHYKNLQFHMLGADTWYANVGPYSPLYGQDEVTMQQLLQYVQEHAVQYRDIGVTSQDSVIALSTCAESATNGRVVLFGKLQESSDNKQK